MDTPKKIIITATNEEGEVLYQRGYVKSEDFNVYQVVSLGSGDELEEYFDELGGKLHQELHKDEN